MRTPDEILSPSILAPVALAPAHKPPRVFDTCKVGIVLRTVLGLEIVIATVALFVTQGFGLWLTQTALITVGALPAALAWLLVICAVKNKLEHSSRAWQFFFASVLGYCCGLYAGAVLMFLRDFSPQHIWASGLVGMQASLAMMVYLIWRAAAQQPAATAAQLSELQARIRPHFLFNTLNSAIALIRSEPRRAERVLEDLSELFRGALAERTATVTLEEEIELAKHYLAIEQVRFEGRLRVIWDIDPAVNKTQVPALILQPLVENAVKHGVEPSSSGADILVMTQRRGDMAHIRVCNTVTESQGAKGHGIALKNVRDRLVLLHDVQCEFRAGIKNGQYQVRIDIPLSV